VAWRLALANAAWRTSLLQDDVERRACVPFQAFEGIVREAAAPYHLYRGHHLAA